MEFQAKNQNRFTSVNTSPQVHTWDTAAVVRNPSMRTARNVFIVNLAVSDLMLCLITMPLTLVEILYQAWQVRVFYIKL